MPLPVWSHAQFLDSSLVTAIDELLVKLGVYLLLFLSVGDLSTNNWFWAVFGAGEGWHHNHHAFKYSARMGLEVRMV